MSKRRSLDRASSDRWRLRTVSIFALGVLFWACGVASQPPSGEEISWRGALAIRAGQVLHTEDPDRLFAPGSVLKLVVATAALHHLGPDSRITTTLAARGSIVDRRLDGDLVLLAAGDPTWNVRFDEEGKGRTALRDLARQVQRRIERVDGNLIIDRSQFPGRPYPVSRPISEAAFAYAAPTSAIAIDENRIFVDIAPGDQVGVRGQVRGDSPWEFVNRTRTVDRDRNEKGTVEFLPIWGSRSVIVRGEYPISESPYRVPISVPWPDLHAAEALREELENLGVVILGKIRLVDQPFPTHTALARIESPTLAERLSVILEDSHNWHAEMLLLQLALQVGGKARLSDGLDIETQFLEDVVGVEPGSFVLEDGSGLSPYNLLSPRAVTRLLAWSWQQPWRDAFLKALPTAEEGTLQAWRRLPPLHAKTGTIRHSLGLAGYLTTSGEPTIFACFLNHRADGRSSQRAEIVTWLRQLSRR